MAKKDCTHTKRKMRKKGDASKFTRKNDTISKPKLQKNKAARKEAKKKSELDPKLIKEKLKERINAIPHSTKNTICLEWVSKSVSISDEKSVVDKVVVNGCYGPLNAHMLCQIQNQIKLTQMTISQAISLRSAYLQQKTMFRHRILLKQAKSVFNQYKRGMNVLDLAKKLDQPPMNVFRVILSEMKWSKNQIRKALRDPKTFKERERNELLVAESMDIISMANQNDIHKNSEEFEVLLSAWLKEKGIRFSRQKELEIEQKKNSAKLF